MLTSSGHALLAEEDGEVTAVDAREIAVVYRSGKKKTYKLHTFVRSNQGTCFNMRPQVTRGQTVTIFGAAGGASALVPNVAGDDADAARTELVDAGFKVDEEPESSDTVAKGTVIRTDPAAGD